MRYKIYINNKMKTEKIIFSAYFGCDKSIWTGYGYRTCEHCIQL